MKHNFKTSSVEHKKSVNSEEASLPRQARQHAPAAVAELARIIENTRSDAARLAAIGILFDRGLGKPPKPLEIAIKDRVKPAPPLSREESAEYFKRLRMNPWSIDGLDDADAAGTPRKGES
jgi:hypothetical protein